MKPWCLIHDIDLINGYCPKCADKVCPTCGNYGSYPSEKLDPGALFPRTKWVKCTDPFHGEENVKGCPTYRGDGFFAITSNEKDCPTCHGKGTIQPPITDSLEKFDALNEKLGPRHIFYPTPDTTEPKELCGCGEWVYAGEMDNHNFTEHGNQDYDMLTDATEQVENRPDNNGERIMKVKANEIYVEWIKETERIKIESDWPAVKVVGELTRALKRVANRYGEIEPVDTVEPADTSLRIRVIDAMSIKSDITVYLEQVERIEALITAAETKRAIRVLEEVSVMNGQLRDTVEMQNYIADRIMDFEAELKESQQ